MIVGDFDADGATNCLLKCANFKDNLVFSDVDYLVPNRFEQVTGSIPVAEMAIEKVFSY